MNKRYERPRPKREPKYTIYIICEDSKSGYNYLKNIRKSLRLKNVSIDIDSGKTSGSDPKSLLNYAKKKTETGYDEVWCVFDSDGRLYIDSVLANASKRPKVKAAFSNPSIELWYFLHYNYSTTPINQEKILRTLIKYIPKYSKSFNVFPVLPDKVKAVEGAMNLREHHKQSGNKETENPSTSVDKLVELLLSLNG